MRPAIDEQVTLKSLSTFSGGTTEKAVSWTITPNTDMTILGGRLDTPQLVIKFGTKGDRNITLKVTDTDNFECSKILSYTIGRTIPRFREIK